MMTRMIHANQGLGGKSSRRDGIFVDEAPKPIFPLHRSGILLKRYRPDGAGVMFVGIFYQDFVPPGRVISTPDSHESLFFAVAMLHYFIDDINFAERHVFRRVLDEAAQQFFPQFDFYEVEEFEYFQKSLFLLFVNG